MFSRSRPVGLSVDPSDRYHEVWSLLDPLSVVCCRLQTLIEARSDAQSTTMTSGGDVRWQAGLLSSVDRVTNRLRLLTTSTASTAASRSTAVTAVTDISSSFTVSLFTILSVLSLLVFSNEHKIQTIQPKR